MQRQFTVSNKGNKQYGRFLVVPLRILFWQLPFGLEEAKFRKDKTLLLSLHT